MIIKKEGSITFLFDTVKNPEAFKKDVTIKWGEFMIDNESSIIVTDHNTLFVIMNPDTERQLTVFSSELENIREDKNHVGLTWSPKKVSLYFNGILVQSLDISDL